MKKQALLLLLALSPIAAAAQQTLTLEECRQMAIEKNKTLDENRTKLEMAGYDRKIAQANYFPKITAYGTWQHLGGGFSLIDDTNIPTFANAGTMVKESYENYLNSLTQIISSSSEIAALLMQSEIFQDALAKLKSVDVTTGLNSIGSKIDESIDKAIHPDLSNVYGAAVSLQQPIFMGGKIVAANKMAKLAEDLARMEYNGNYDEALVEVDKAYWQVVSVANKRKLAESYNDLLQKMLHNVELSVKEGVATQADELTVKVKANEAEMTLTQATNGLALAKMLLCKEVGLPLDTQITLADENSEKIPIPDDDIEKSMEEIYEARSETQRLETAAQIYDQKVNIARADMLPKVAFTANYAVTNPTMNHGFKNEWGPHWSAGVIVSVPIFHGFEALQKTRKAKAEATIYRTKYDDAREMINLQVTQLRQQQKEALERLKMSESNLSSAEENLRTATIGFEAGVVDANTALGAHTAWLQAHSAYIDAGIEVQMNNANIKKAQGSYTSDVQAAYEEQQKNK